MTFENIHERDVRKQAKQLQGGSRRNRKQKENRRNRKQKEHMPRAVIHLTCRNQVGLMCLEWI